MKSIFEYRNYKVYLRELIESYPQGGRGLRKQLATAAGCQLPYISHVLNGDYHFSSEQIDGIARYLKLEDSEREFLLLLAQHQRASTNQLSNFYKKLIEKSASSHLSIKEKIKPKHSLSSEDRTIYYSSWVYAAIHMLITIPEFQVPSNIAKRLKLSDEKVMEVIKFLTTRGLAKTQNGRLQALQFDLHLEDSATSIIQHHTNWRLQAIDAVNFPQENDLHYSLAFTASHQDLIRIREALSDVIKKCADIIRPSPEEEISVFNVDLFRMRS